jgi:hypothetical protein
MLAPVEHADVGSWVEAYERLWRTPGTDRLGELFTPDVSYGASPWDEPVRGLAALAQFWDAEREGPYEQFGLRYEIVAVDAAIAVVRAEVDYASGDSWLDLWLITFAADGRCASFEEWPIAPPAS